MQHSIRFFARRNKHHKFFLCFPRLEFKVSRWLTLVSRWFHVGFTLVKGTFNRLQWQPIKSTLNQREEVMVCKALRKMTPTYISDLFHTCHNDTYTLRSNDRKLYLPKPKTNFLKKSFLYRGATAWNNLPNEIVDDFENHSLPAFKRLLKAQ